MDSTFDEPPVKRNPMEDNPASSKRTEAETSRVREKALGRFLNRRGYLVPAPEREEVYPLETISAKRGENRKRNM